MVTVVACALGLLMLTAGVGIGRLHIAGAYCLVEGGIIASALAAGDARRRRPWLITFAAAVCLLGYLAIGFIIFPRNVDEMQTDLRAMQMTQTSPRH